MPVSGQLIMYSVALLLNKVSFVSCYVYIFIVTLVKAASASACKLCLKGSLDNWM